MLNTVYISGRFVNRDTQEPIDGPVELIPSRLWVEVDGVAYATRSAHSITRNGYFVLPVTSVTPTEEVVGWHYQIKCPMGIWTIKPEGEDGTKLHLRELLPSNFSQ